MLRRAARWMVIALIAAIFGFTGILHWTAMIAQSVFFVCFGMSLLSLLFSLFEELPDRVLTNQDKTAKTSLESVAG